jgi:hypothetical protein
LRGTKRTGHVGRSNMLWEATNAESPIAAWFVPRLHSLTLNDSRRCLDTGCIVAVWPRSQLQAPPRKASFFRPRRSCGACRLCCELPALSASLAASSLFGPVSPFLVPSLQRSGIGAPGACQNAPLGAGPEDFFAPFLGKKIPDPLLTGEDAEIRSRTDGAKLS